MQKNTVHLNKTNRVIVAVLVSPKADILNEMSGRVFTVMFLVPTPDQTSRTALSQH